MGSPGTEEKGAWWKRALQGGGVGGLDQWASGIHRVLSEEARGSQLETINGWSPHSPGSDHALPPPEAHLLLHDFEGWGPGTFLLTNSHWGHSRAS